MFIVLVGRCRHFRSTNSVAGPRAAVSHDEAVNRNGIIEKDSKQVTAEGSEYFTLVANT
jgi:hypothetical protein